VCWAVVALSEKMGEFRWEDRMEQSIAKLFCYVLDNFISLN